MFAPGIQALLNVLPVVALALLLMAAPAQAQQAAAEEGKAPAPASAPVQPPVAAPEQAAQDSAAAFDEAANAGKELAPEAMPAKATGSAPEDAAAGAQADADQGQKTPQQPSYGTFLDHPKNSSQDHSPDASLGQGQNQDDRQPVGSIMDTGNSLIASTLTTAAYLCLILGGIFLAFWLLRRFGPRGIARSRDMINPQIVGRLALGQKQHVDVIRVQGRTYLLGVTDHSINLLTEIEVQPGQCFDDEDENEFTDFTEMLGKQAASGSDSDGA